MLDEPEHLGRERLGGGADARPSRSTRQLTSTTSSSARFGIAPSLRTFTTWTSPVPACSDATSAAAASLVPRARRAPRAASASRRGRDRGRARGGPASISITSSARMCPARCCGEHPLGQVVVAQVRAGDRADARGSARSAGPRTSRPADVREQLRQPVVAVDEHLPLPGQVVEADVLELHALGLDAEAARPSRAGTRSRRCRARAHGAPASSSAWITSPVGFVKSTNHAPGAPISAVSSASSSTTGTVRSAFANPPGPVVSCPMQPNRSGIVSSR